ncbi:5931_t:CDS:10 [Scutellospora calospora]|uniref:5931_t:CDS:1 n=1 Tax=Scutellospora calospora TaxID=85575 RepID=A0ACA9KDI1_9GLOM|nr:5931_t:CDS:10 [Scutellospora calospora]
MEKRKSNSFFESPLFSFLVQHELLSKTSSITLEHIFAYYQKEWPNSEYLKIYNALSKDLDDALDSNFYNNDIVSILKNIKNTWNTWNKKRFKQTRHNQFDVSITKYQKGIATVVEMETNKWVEEALNNDCGVLTSNEKHINTKDIPKIMQKKYHPDNEEEEYPNKWDLRPRKKVNYADDSSSDSLENDFISQESTQYFTNILTPNIDIKIDEQENGNDKYRYDVENLKESHSSNVLLSPLTNVLTKTSLQQTLNDFSLLSVLRQYCMKKSTSPYDPAHSFILDLSSSSKIRGEFSYEKWFEFLKRRPEVVKRTYHHEIEPFILHLFEHDIDLSQARSKWAELQNVNAPIYKKEFSYKKNNWKKIQWWIQRVVGQFLDAFESFRNPLENGCHEREWTGDYIIPLIQGVLKLDGNCFVPWGEISVLATQNRRNNNKDINTEKVIRGRQADFLCKYEQYEIVCGLVCGGPHFHDLTKHASDQFYLKQMMKDMLDNLRLKFFYSDKDELYTLGIHVYMTEVRVYLIEKQEVYFFHHLKSFNLPLSFSAYHSLKGALRTAWNIRGLVNSLIRKFNIIVDNNDGFKTPPMHMSDDMKTQ